MSEWEKERVSELESERMREWDCESEGVGEWVSDGLTEVSEWVSGEWASAWVSELKKPCLHIGLVVYSTLLSYVSSARVPTTGFRSYVPGLKWGRRINMGNSDWTIRRTGQWTGNGAGRVPTQENVRRFGKLNYCFAVFCAKRVSPKQSVSRNSETSETIPLVSHFAKAFNQKPHERGSCRSKLKFIKKQPYSNKYSTAHIKPTP
jgi:hypothetical protein